MEESTQLAQSITVVIDGEKRETLMSFALLNRCTALVGDPDNVELISMNTELRDLILCEVYAERDSKGKVLKEVKMDEILVSLEDIENTLDWVTEHVLNFTLRALERASKRKGRNKEKLSQLMSSILGSSNLNSPTSAV